ncbi:putative Histidine kinase [Candidatus Terasakiella magnetica]|uniref:Sensory/regulatory protein RpfC n=1 Tax=Candidatus Terasakiella magnetica TaxID=1867952 RepID=A0A1C3RDI8_9PROT|nr:response regulator [Candidatus Terasakiella magnetica]SCA55329.1 putative Histidine kinase [Candidatus Terasakiella magnetica]
MIKFLGGIEARIAVTLTAASLVLAFVILFLAHVYTKNTDNAALMIAAKSYSQAISSFRTFYTNVILDNIHTDAIEVTHEYASKENAIPIPATFSIDLVQFLNGTDTRLHVSLGSEYPFPWRKDRQIGAFTKKALAYFSQTPDESFYELLDENAERKLKFATPIIMGEACVACHNAHPDTPKNDWKIGDVRGVQVVTVPEQSLAGRGDIWFAYLVLAFSVFLIITFSAVALLLKRNKTVLDHLNDEKERLAQANVSLSAKDKDLRSALEHANAASEAKSEFLATMSHEIRTPMNGVIGMTGLLLESELSKQQKHYAETIRGSGEALLHIINDILDYSKMEAGRLRLEMETIKLRTLIEEVVELLGPRAYEKNIELAYIVTSEVLPYYEGDSGRLRQILLNLIGNSIKFTEQGGVSLAVELSDQGYLKFIIRDTGIGISQDHQEKLFSSFSQVDSSIARRFGGTGLGLAICKQLVELMDGRIGVDSELGQGSSFWFEVPLHQATPLVDAPVKDKPKQWDKALNGLIVDDNPINREIFARQLENWNVKPSVAQSVLDAQSALKNQAFDFLLLDVQMPDQSGLEMIEFLQADEAYKDVKVIFASSIHKEDVEREKVIERADAFLTKPVHQSNLYNTLLGLFGTGGSQQKETYQQPKQKELVSETCLRILVAEDNYVNQEVVTGFLRKMGHHSDVVGNGLEAVEAVKTIPYDLVLMDVQMPNMDGYTATGEIRKLDAPKCNIPIIAVTANAMKGDADKCLQAGMNQYLAKPIDKQELYDAIAQTFGLESQDMSVPQTALPSEKKDEGSSVVDWDFLYGREEDLDKESIEMLLGSLFNKMPERLEKLSVAIKEADSAALKKEAHSLKGVALTMGLKAIGEQAEALEGGIELGEGNEAWHILQATEQLVQDSKTELEKRYSL